MKRLLYDCQKTAVWLAKADAVCNTVYLRATNRWAVYIKRLQKIAMGLIPL
jgi:hypothetical protein